MQMENPEAEQTLGRERERKKSAKFYFLNFQAHEPRRALNVPSLLGVVHKTSF